MGETLLSVQDLRVDYETMTAVKDVSFEIEAGMIYALIGPNGAGKTSIIRAVADVLDPTYGDIHINGHNLADQPRQALRYLGYMPDFPPLYEDLTLRQFLAIFASAYGVPKGQRNQKIDALLEEVDLGDRADESCKGMSRGMRQRLFLAKTLISDPKVLLLDEPASGLDPLARQQLSSIIRRLGEEGRAVLVSSHILSELREFCNAVGVMDQGHMKVTGLLKDILDEISPDKLIEIQMLHGSSDFGDFLNAKENISDLTLDGANYSLSFQGSDEELARFLKSIVDGGYPIIDFHHRQKDIQDLFMEVSGEKS